jgi:LemA protein
MQRPQIVLLALFLLPSLGSEAPGQKKEDVPELVKQLKASVSDRRKAAAQALGRIGPDAKEALKPLAEAMKDAKFWDERIAMIEALTTIGAESREEVLPVLVGALEYAHSFDEPRALIKALRAFKAQAKEVVAALAQALHKAEFSRDRIALADYLGTFGTDAKDAIPALREMSQRGALAEDRKAAAAALRRVQGGPPRDGEGPRGRRRPPLPGPGVPGGPPATEQGRSLGGGPTAPDNSRSPATGPTTSQEPGPFRLDYCCWCCTLTFGLPVLVWIGWKGYRATSSIYNDLIVKREGTHAAWSNIDVELKRRWDLIPRLVETVKAYAGHERETFERVTQARTAAMCIQNRAERAHAEDDLASSLHTLLIFVKERYPNLKASRHFMNLEEELSGIEERIASARRDYNGVVRVYNTAVQSFPANILYTLFRFEQVEYFGLDAPAERTPPIIRF